MTRASDQTVALPSKKPPRPYWVLAVVGAYILILLFVLIAPWFALAENDGGGFAILTAIFLLLLAGLMFVPIQIRRQRPITRRSIWVPLLVTGILAGVLAGAGVLAIIELMKVSLDSMTPVVLGSVGVWSLWAGLFYLMARSRGRTRVALALHRWVMAGTILELLVAVPCHIVVRRRTECCAGMMTGSAIVVGVLIAILAFGPSVALLYVRRWRRIQVPPGEERGFEVLPGRDLGKPEQANTTRLR